MAKKKFGRLTPIIPSFLYRNQLTICAGGPYTGKTRFALHLANSLALGKETFLGEFPPMRILFCSERDWDFNSEQLRTVGYEELPDNVQFFCVPDVPAKDVALFESDQLKYISGIHFSSEWTPDLVIFDTAQHFMLAAKGDSTNSYTYNVRELLRFKRWSTKYNLASLLVHHSPKQNERSLYKDPFDRILGSVAILGASVGACILERMSDEELRIYFKSHLTAVKSPRSFAYSDLHELIEGEITIPALKASPLEETILEVVEKMAGDYTKYSDLVDTLSSTMGKKDNQVRNILNSLIKKNLIDFKLDEMSETRYIRKKLKQ